MNKIELKEKLDGMAIDPDYYTLDGGTFMNSSVILDHSYNHYSGNNKYDEWRVYFIEWGARYNEKIYYSEEEACDDIFERFNKTLS